MKLLKVDFDGEIPATADVRLSVTELACSTT